MLSSLIKATFGLNGLMPAKAHSSAHAVTLPRDLGDTRAVDKPTARVADIAHRLGSTDAHMW